MFDLPGLDTIGTEESLNLVSSRRPAFWVNEEEAWEIRSPGSPTPALPTLLECPKSNEEQLLQPKQQRLLEEQAQEQQQEAQNASTVASKDPLDLNLRDLESKLKLISVQRSVSALKCEMFLDYLESQSQRIRANHVSFVSVRAERRGAASVSMPERRARQHTEGMPWGETCQKLPFPYPDEPWDDMTLCPLQGPGKLRRAYHEPSLSEQLSRNVVVANHTPFTRSRSGRSKQRKSSEASPHTRLTSPRVKQGRPRGSPQELPSFELSGPPEESLTRTEASGVKGIGSWDHESGTPALQTISKNLPQKSPLMRHGRFEPEQMMPPLLKCGGNF